MKTKLPLILALVSLAVAVAAGWFAYAERWERRERWEHERRAEIQDIALQSYLGVKSIPFNYQVPDDGNEFCLLGVLCFEDGKPWGGGMKRAAYIHLSKDRRIRGRFFFDRSGSLMMFTEESMPNVRWQHDGDGTHSASRQGAHPFWSKIGSYGPMLESDGPPTQGFWYPTNGPRPTPPLMTYDGWSLLGIAFGEEFKDDRERPIPYGNFNAYFNDYKYVVALAFRTFKTEEERRLYRMTH